MTLHDASGATVNASELFSVLAFASSTAQGGGGSSKIGNLVDVMPDSPTSALPSVHIVKSLTSKCPASFVLDLLILLPVRKRAT